MGMQEYYIMESSDCTLISRPVPSLVLQHSTSSNNDCGSHSSSTEEQSVHHFSSMDSLAAYFWTHPSGPVLQSRPCVIRNAPVHWPSPPPLPTSPVSVHVSKDPALDFTRKNFSYQYMTLQQLLDAIQQSDSSASTSMNGTEEDTNGGTFYYYFRSLGKRPFKDKAHLADLNIASPLPHSLDPTSQTSQYHSSVLRISHSPVQLWLHYDIPDNFLVQLEGTKKVLLFNPKQVHSLYMSGSSSRVPVRFILLL
eukprot:GHVS01051167.1.p1 GENE.GHVS01051167.1~~GHVS01051167.1.p1  ORF type:complete len:252 (-),score=30.44 GHVS01051167.1:128-883(-)